MKRALVIAAHPDDEVLGCAATISKYSAIGVEFVVVFVGEGSSCRFSSAQAEGVTLAISERRTAAERALDFLLVSKREFHDLPCGRFDQVPIIEINKIIETAISQYNPDTVFTHSQFDANNDHKVVHAATVMATRPAGRNRVSRLFSYEVLSSSEWAFTSAFIPNYFEEVSETDVSRKIGALQFYDSEVREYPFPRCERGLRNLAEMRGMQSGALFAEAFSLVREFRQ